MFYKTQKKMTRKKPKQTNNYYLLKGKLYCDCCGDVWTGRTRYKDMSKYYRCQNIERRYKKNNPQREHLIKDCNNPKQIEYETMNNEKITELTTITVLTPNLALVKAKVLPSCSLSIAA